MKLSCKSTTFLLLVILFAISSEVHAQSFGQDSDGFSTLIVPSSSLSLDLVNENAVFTYLDYIDDEYKWVIGGELKGESKNGVSNIFKSSEFVSESSVKFLIGKYFCASDIKTVGLSSNNYLLKDKYLRDINDLNNSLDYTIKSIQTLLDDVDDNSIVLPPSEKRAIKIEITAPIDENKIIQRISKLKSLKSNIENGQYHNEQSNLASIVNSLRINFDFIKNIIPAIRDTNNKRNELELEIRHNSSWFWYFRFGGSGLSYRVDGGIGESIDDVFPKDNFNGFNFEFGVNYSNGNNFIGLSSTMNYTNNLSQLKQKVFEVIEEDSESIEGSLIRAKTEVKAYETTKVDLYHRYDINLDYAYIIALKESDKMYLSFNPYFRLQMFHGSKNFKNSTNFGLGLFAFNSETNKLLGGSFVQANDVFGVNDDPNKDISLLDRFNFGLVVRFGFTGINAKKKSKS